MRVVASVGTLAIAAIGALLFWSAKDPARIQAVEPLRMAAATEGARVSVFWPSQDDAEGVEPFGVAVGPDGSVYVLHRGGRAFGGDTTPISDPVILRLDARTGDVIDRFGAGVFASPHGLDVGKDGSIWVTDIALNMVVRLNGEGQVVRRYGDPYPFYLEALLRLRNWFPRLPVPMSDTTFARPTDIALLSGERFAVTDGYRNSRLAVFGFDAALLWQIDRRGSQPGSFHLPHGLTSDSADRLYVADRRNARIQVFSGDGHLLRIIENGTVGRPFGIEIGPEDCLFIADGGDGLDTGNETGGGIGLTTREGDPILRFGSAGQGKGGFELPHDIAVAPSGRAYVADMGAKHVKVIDFPGKCGP